MKFRILQVYVLIMMVCLGNCANATLITDLSERDWINTGDKALTYDQTTGLEWLDLSYTHGNSILETEAESFFGEFRWATATEVDSILNAVLIGTGLRHSADVDVVVRAMRFQELFSKNGNISQGFIRDPTPPNGDHPLGQVTVQAAFQVTVGDTSAMCCSDETLKDPHTGAWLVRSTEVPEPSTLAILAIGLMGLASRRFKKQS